MSIVPAIRSILTNRQAKAYTWGISQPPSTWTSSAESASPLVLPPSSSDHRSRRDGASVIRPLHQPHRLPPPRCQVREYLQVLLPVLRSGREVDKQEQHPGSLCRWHLKSSLALMQSSTLVIAYLMRKNNWSFKDAIAFVTKKRPNVLPNLGFERQLK